MKNYAALVIPALLSNTDATRVVELLEALTNDSNNQLRLAMYLNGTLNKPADSEFKSEIAGEDFTKLINSDSDYRNRTAVFKKYNFITNEIVYDIVGGEYRHSFKTQEDADKWVAGDDSVRGNWRKSEEYPFEAWRPCSTNKNCTSDADKWFINKD